MAGAEPQIDLQNFSIPPAGSLDMDDLIDLYESIRPWLPTPRPADTRRADRMGRCWTMWMRCCWTDLAF